MLLNTNVRFISVVGAMNDHRWVPLRIRLEEEEEGEEEDWESEDEFERWIPADDEEEDDTDR